MMLDAAYIERAAFPKEEGTTLKSMVIGALVLIAALSATALPLGGNGEAEASWGAPVPEQPVWGERVPEQPVWGDGPTRGFGEPKCYGVFVPGFGCLTGW